MHYPSFEVELLRGFNQAFSLLMFFQKMLWLEWIPFPHMCFNGCCKEEYHWKGDKHHFVLTICQDLKGLGHIGTML